MKKNIFMQAVLFIPLLFLLSGTAYPFTEFFSAAEKPTPASEQKAEPVAPATTALAVQSAIRISSTGSGVQIRIRNAPLVEVLQQVANETEIRFRVPAGLTATRLNADIDASDWESGLRALLKDISLVELWDQKAKVSQIVLLKGTRWTSESESKEEGPRNQPVHIRSQGGKSGDGDSMSLADQEIILSNDQLQELGMGPYRSPLPVALFEKPEYRKFLALHGIESTEDLQMIEKAKAVRRAARKQLYVPQTRPAVEKASLSF